MIYMRPEMQFQSTTKEILFALLFIAGEIQWNFVFVGGPRKTAYAKEGLASLSFIVLYARSYCYFASPKY